MGWVEMLIYCSCGIWCKNINRQVYEQMKAAYQELKGCDSFFGNSVRECEAKAIAEGWRRDRPSGTWNCPVCVAEFPGSGIKLRT